MGRENLTKGLELIKQGLGILQGGPLNYYLEKAFEYQEALFDRFAPFKAGDRVALVEAFKTDDERHGWYGCQHFLVKGAEAVVESVDYKDGRFIADVVFDNESWIDDKGKVRLVEQKHTFAFGESRLKRITPRTKTSAIKE